jgi:hypothetical protein
MADQVEEITPVIDWNDYRTERNEDGEKYVIHDIYACGASDTYLWSLQEALDWVKEHHKICRKVG